jgi:hypothetical protein
VNEEGRTGREGLLRGEEGESLQKGQGQRRRRRERGTGRRISIL